LFQRNNGEDCGCRYNQPYYACNEENNVVPLSAHQKLPETNQYDPEDGGKGDESLTNHLRYNFTQPVTILERNEEEDFLELKLSCCYLNGSKKQFKRFSKLRISKTKAWKEAKKLRN
jgi:hypothetical protein